MVSIRSNQEFRNLQNLVVQLDILLAAGNEDMWFFGKVELEFERQVVTCRPETGAQSLILKLMETSGLVRLHCGTGEGLLRFLGNIFI